jgi:hypothetical protein
MKQWSCSMSSQSKRTLKFIYEAIQKNNIDNWIAASLYCSALLRNTAPRNDVRLVSF